MFGTQAPQDTGVHFKREVSKRWNPESSVKNIHLPTHPFIKQNTSIYPPTPSFFRPYARAHTIARSRVAYTRFCNWRPSQVIRRQPAGEHMAPQLTGAELDLIHKETALGKAPSDI